MYVAQLGCGAYELRAAVRARCARVWIVDLLDCEARGVSRRGRGSNDVCDGTRRFDARAADVGVRRRTLAAGSPCAWILASIWARAMLSSCEARFRLADGEPEAMDAGIGGEFWVSF